MANCLDIAHFVVFIGLTIVPNGPGVVRIGSQPRKRIFPMDSVRWSKVKGGLSDVLSTLSRDKPVDRIVTIIRTGLDIFVVVLNSR